MTIHPEISARGLLIPAVTFGYLSPGQGSEGGKSRPLDHMRQTPFLGSAVPPYYFEYNFDRYIFENVVVVQCILRFEHSHMLKNDRMAERSNLLFNP